MKNIDLFSELELLILAKLTPDDWKKLIGKINQIGLDNLAPIVKSAKAEVDALEEEAKEAESIPGGIPESIAPPADNDELTFDDGETPDEPSDDLQKEADEAEFYIQQGLLSDARSIFEKLLSQHPKSKLVKSELAKVKRAIKKETPLKGKEREPSIPDGTKPLVSQAEEPEDGEMFDLKAEIEELKNQAAVGPETEQVNFDDVFSAFKRGVEKTVSKEDTDAHYDLGLAYMEMGLVDDAIGEFRVSLADKNRETQSHEMMGICYMEKGDIKKAALSFATAKQCEGVTEEQKIVLYFRMAKAIEHMDPEEALRYCDHAAELYQKMRKEKPQITIFYTKFGPGSSTVETQARCKSKMVDLWDKIEETKKSLRKYLKKPRRRVSYT